MNSPEEIRRRILEKIGEKFDKKPKPIILCLGNQVMGDDAAGYIVAKKLEEEGLSENVVYAGTNPLDFARKLRESDTKIIIVVDAIQAQLQPGEIIVEWLENIKEVKILTTTHNISLDTLRQLVGKEMLIIGIQGSNYEIGAEPTKPVARVATTVAEALATLVKHERAATN